MISKTYAEITLKNGNTLSLDPDNFAASGNYISQNTDISSLPIGAIITRSAHISIINANNEFSDVDFTGAEVTLKMDNPGYSPYAYIGAFNVTNKYTYSDVIELDLIDDTIKLDKEYVPTNSTEGARPISVIEDIANQLGFDYSPDYLEPDFYPTFQFRDNLLGYTYREMLSEIAKILGCCVVMSRYAHNELIFRPIEPTLTVGTLNSWAESNMSYDNKHHTITGVRALIKNADGTTEKRLYGNETGEVYEYVSRIHPYARSDFQTNVANKIIGLSYRNFSGNLLNKDQFIENIIDDSGNTRLFPTVIDTFRDGDEFSFNSYITSFSYEFLGGCTVECDILENNTQYSSLASSEAQEIAKDLVKKNQGSANAGKVMIIDQTGNAVPQQLDDYEISNHYGYYQTHDGLLIQWDTVRITPTAPNTPTTEIVEFPLPYAFTPSVTITALSASPQTVDVSILRDTTVVGDAKLYTAIVLSRSAGGETSINWLAIGKAAN